MSEPIEVSRVDVTASEGSYTSACVVCGKAIVLWMNGGELDGTNCCGYRYDLEAPRIDFVVRKEPPPRRTIELASGALYEPPPR